MPKIDPYDVLGVDQNATDDEIRDAYRREVKRTHPDAFVDVQTAMAILGNRERRSRHDAGEDDVFAATNEEERIVASSIMRIIRLTIGNDSLDFDHEDIAKRIRLVLAEALQKIDAEKAKCERELARLDQLAARMKKTRELSGENPQDEPMWERGLADIRTKIKRALDVEIPRNERAHVRVAAIFEAMDYRFDRGLSLTTGQQIMRDWTTVRPSGISFPFRDTY